MTDEVTDAIETYRDRYTRYLTEVARQLKALVSDQLAGTAHVDRVTARAKDPDRFAYKAAAKHPDGAPKYRRPLTEIQDQLGARVVVFYLGDVRKVLAVLERYFRHIEDQELVPESYWEFGYFGHHTLMALPRDVIPREIAITDVPGFFELQIKTLFQHAWSEANHDLGYKSSAPLGGDQQRRLAYTAAQAWGADQAFEVLRGEIDPSSLN